MEDIDPPREEAGAAEAILHSLETHGLLWDGEVLWQHNRLSAYAEITHQLLTSGLAYRCDCRRKDLAQLGPKYSGHCRTRNLPESQPHAVRLLVDDRHAGTFTDVFQGEQAITSAESAGDFIIRRRDGLPAYQLAVAVDDAYQGISSIVRGADLLDSTPRQVLSLIHI